MPRATRWVLACRAVRVVLALPRSWEREWLEGGATCVCVAVNMVWLGPVLTPTRAATGGGQLYSRRVLQ